MIPLSGTSTGSAGKAGPHLQAWLDEKKAAEEKRKELEGDTGALSPIHCIISTKEWRWDGRLMFDILGEDKKGLRARMKHIFRPVSYPKEEWEGGR